MNPRRGNKINCSRKGKSCLNQVAKQWGEAWAAAPSILCEICRTIFLWLDIEGKYWTRENLEWVSLLEQLCEIEEQDAFQEKWVLVSGMSIGYLAFKGIYQYGSVVNGKCFCHVIWIVLGKWTYCLRVFLLKLPNTTKTYPGSGEHNLFWLAISFCVGSLLAHGNPLVEEHEGISHYGCTWKLIIEGPVSVCSCCNMSSGIVLLWLLSWGT